MARTNPSGRIISIEILIEVSAQVHSISYGLIRNITTVLIIGHFNTAKR